MEPDDVSFPEDFYTDSPVHISKLSNKEFRRKRELLFRRIIKNQSIEYNHYWNQEMADQYMLTVNRRARYSLPLPEPVDLTNLKRKDLLAVFSKMHSRSFARSMRLCKDVNKLLNKNLTKFSIRIRSAVINTFDERHQLGLNMRRGVVTNRWKPISDPSSILPFTFSAFHCRWNGKAFREVFDQMKWPVEERRIELFYDTLLHPRPWMTELDSLWFCEMNSTHVILENWKLVKELKPKAVWFCLDSNELSASELLDSAPRVYIARFPKEEPHKNYGLSTIVKKWRSGEWNHTATYITGRCLEPRENFYREVADCFSFELKGYKLFFVPSPSNSYLLLQTWEDEERTLFEMVPNISQVSDMDIIEHFFGGLKSYPVDYSAYSGDLDSVIDPQAFCALLANYRF